jgi:hypothetical protein
MYYLTSNGIIMQHIDAAIVKRQFKISTRNTGASGRRAAGPGYTLVSFLPAAKKDTASIPCAFRQGLAMRGVA